MRNVYPKIFLLLLSLWVDNLNAIQSYVPCVKGFIRNTDTNAVCAVSFTLPPYRSQYDCVYTSCSYNPNGTKWVPMPNCQLIGSKDKGVSNQKCIMYDYNEKLGNFACTNAAGKSYACPYTPQTVPAMVCTDCNLYHQK
ncbi:uncharacterized protein MELLADRAFT_123576 [Melampsora larici-populina 98AG31]|uniref:Secreted protein n=1 Tax=Melampsora larici-populina (strain 98AG31 / pathotype 3-4-7) TaxID=747676 RepID=F4RMY9_MELLP|nr:uncharacterized protein MELLADRAFT_123576 [Melampsora larici-populina 98AG31]EGG06200.1 secreted protein [Melampsora larici-populina 98AG31]